MIGNSGLKLSRRDAIAGIGVGAAALAASGAQATKPVDKVKIHHVEGRRSQRIIWFCEEARIPYEVVYKRGDLLGSLNDLKVVNPDMPVAPTVEFRGQTLVESGGIMEYLISQFSGASKLAPPVNSPDFAKYKMWIHFAEGSAMPHLSGDLAKMARTDGILRPKVMGPLKMVGSMDVILMLEKHLAEKPYFGGANFSAADIMFDIVMTIIDNMALDHDIYPNLLKWHERVKARPAYIRAMEVGNPDNVVLKVPLPKPEDVGAATPAEAAHAAASVALSSSTTTIGILLANPAAKAAIDKRFPDFSTSSAVESGMANSMTLRSLQQFKPDMFTDKTLDALDADLAKLSVK